MRKLAQGAGHYAPVCAPSCEFFLEPFAALHTPEPIQIVKIHSNHPRNLFSRLLGMFIPRNLQGNSNLFGHDRSVLDDHP